MTDARELADLLVAPGRPDAPLLRQGVVSAVGVGSLSVQLAGSPYAIGNVRYLDSYAPVVGDVVWMLKNGPDLLVLGTIETIGNGQSNLKPWGAAWGRVGAAAGGGFAFGTLSPDQISLLDVPVIAGRLYQARYQMRSRSDTAGLLATFSLDRSPLGAGYSTIRNVPITHPISTGATASGAMDWTEDFTPAASGLDDFRIGSTRSTSSGVCTPNYASIAVYDLGPFTA